jgi:hypothetical protein
MMLGFIRVLKFGAVVVVTALMLVGTPTQSRAQTGVININIVKVGFILGIGGGSGTLTFNGNVYPITVGGVSVGTIGIADMQLRGTASNLQNAADLAGTYTATSASVAFVGGAKVAQLQNERGVIIQVSGVEIGLEASLNLGGMTISFQ